MREAALNDWVDRHACEAHCADMCRQSCEFRQLTGYEFGRSKRFSEAKELYFFRPKTDDVDRPVRATKAIIHEYVVDRLLTPHPSASSLPPNAFRTLCRLSTKLVIGRAPAIAQRQDPGEPASVQHYSEITGA